MEAWLDEIYNETNQRSNASNHEKQVVILKVSLKKLNDLEQVDLLFLIFFFSFFQIRQFQISV